VEAPQIEYDKLADDRKGEPSAAIRERVEAARQIQRERLASANLACNTAIRQYFAPIPWQCASARVGPAEIDQFCKLDETRQQLMHSAMQQLATTARAY
jgi:magnesium chelatase family protein